MDDDETIDILADIIVSSHGTKASTVLANRIKECEAKGDTTGIRVWKKVAERISKASKK